MIIRESTHRFSPLSFHRSMVGRRLPLLRTASGRAYIGSCPEAERQEILKILRHTSGIDRKLARDKEYISDLVHRVNRRGYATNYREWDSEQRIAAVAVPIIGEGKIYGCLSIIYIAEAMTLEVALDKHLATLQKTAAKIEAGLSSLGS